MDMIPGITTTILLLAWGLANSKESKNEHRKEYGFLLTLSNCYTQPTLKPIIWEDKISYVLSHFELGSAACSWKHTN